MATGTRRRGAGASATGLMATAVAVAFAALAAWVLGGLLTYAEPGTQAGARVEAEVPAVDDTVLEPAAPPANPSAAISPAASPAASPARTETSRMAGNARRVDEAWAIEQSARTGIPLRALLGYAGAELAMQAEAPACRVGWTTLAGLGHLESGHGTHAGSALGTDGVARPAILGPDLDGAEFDRIDDTDVGALDGSTTTDRAAGPMQFIPSTWRQWGADGSGDGVADPQQIDDASLAAARYLCASGDLADPAGWRRAVFAYNHVESYVDAVAAAASDYAARTRG